MAAEKTQLFLITCCIFLRINGLIKRIFLSFAHDPNNNMFLVFLSIEVLKKKIRKRAAKVRNVDSSKKWQPDGDGRDS